MNLQRMWISCASLDDEVVRVETMKISGEKIVRTEKEIILPRPEKRQRQRSEAGTRSVRQIRHPCGVPAKIRKTRQSRRTDRTAPRFAADPCPHPGSGPPGEIIAGAIEAAEAQGLSDSRTVTAATADPASLNEKASEMFAKFLSIDLDVGIDKIVQRLALLRRIQSRSRPMLNCTRFTSCEPKK